jgi:hypothetical protein
MLLCWNPKMGSPIHNHAGSECFMRVLSGSIVEQQYTVKGGEGDATVMDKCSKVDEAPTSMPLSDLIPTHRNMYDAGGCTFINDTLGGLRHSAHRRT